MGKAITIFMILAFIIPLAYAPRYDWLYNPYTGKQDRSLSLNQSGYNFTVNTINVEGSLVANNLAYLNKNQSWSGTNTFNSDETILVNNPDNFGEVLKVNRSYDEFGTASGTNLVSTGYSFNIISMGEEMCYYVRGTKFDCRTNTGTTERHWANVVYVESSTWGNGGSGRVRGDLVDLNFTHDVRMQFISPTVNVIGDLNASSIRVNGSTITSNSTCMAIKGATSTLYVC